MDAEKKIKEMCGTSNPYRVPDGYFESVRVQIMENLPAYPEAPKAQKLSKWHIVRPYVYLAAMFAGIWCMMKVFHNAADMDQLNIDNPPAQIASYMGDPDVVETMMLPSSMSDDELMYEVSDSYASIEEFEKDFGYEIKPEYDDIDIQ